ncbi:MAG: tetratricopeptide repeat protein [Candidatus Korobacteraceae bacterium]
MPSPERWGGVAIALVIFCTAVSGQQKPSIFGIVHQVEGSPVSHAEVSVEGAGATVTSDSGQFALAMGANLRVGMAAVFHVKNWVIIKPCELRNGRTYLHDPAAEPIEFFVLRRGDTRLKAVNTSWSIIGCVIVEEASQFAKKPKSDSGPRGSLHYMPSQQFQPTYLGSMLKLKGGSSHSLLVEASYKPPLPESWSPPGSQSQGPEGLGGEDFLTAKAKELGFSIEELESAIATWSKSVQDLYQKGLAALYYGKYEEASTYISESIVSSKDDVVDRYVPLARAEFEQGRYAEAEFALRKVLVVHDDDPVLLNNLALTLDAQAKYKEAEPLYQRALAIEGDAFGPNDPSVAALLSNFGDHKVQAGNYSEAEPLYKRALEIDEGATDIDDVAIATVLDNLAVLYEDQGRYTEAEPLYKHALKLDEKALGPNHPSVAKMLDNLAVLYQDQGRYSEAEPLYKRAIEIEEEALGPDHPAEATALSNLAALYQAQGRYAEAEPLYKRALAIDEKAFGPDHPSEARGLSKLAALSQAQGRYNEAEILYKRALAIDEKTLGPDHPSEVTMLSNLAAVYQVQGKYSEAEPLLKQALNITENVLGPDNPKVATRLSSLAAFYKAQGKFSEAEPLYKRALAIDEKAFGPEHPTIAKDLNGLALSYRAQGKLSGVEPLYRRALTIDEKALGPDSPEVAADLDALAWFYYQQEKYAEAEPLYRRALAIKEKWGAGLPAVADAAEDLADALRKLDRDAEAEAYDEQAARIRAKKKQ